MSLFGLSRFTKRTRKMVSVIAVLALLVALIPPTPALAQTQSEIPGPIINLDFSTNLIRGIAGPAIIGVFNPVNGLAYNKVRLQIKVDAPQPFTSTDQVTIVEHNGDPTEGQAIAFTLDENGDLIGWWGPDNGFQMPKGYQVNKVFRVTVKEGAPAGRYTVTANLINLENEESLASSIYKVWVNDQPKPPYPKVRVTTLENLIQGIAVPVIAEALNPVDGQEYNKVRFRIKVDAPQPFTSKDQVMAIAAKGDPAEGQSVAFTLDANGDLIGWWGPENGFQMPPGYQVNTAFGVTVKEGAPTGPYTVTTELVNLEENNRTLARSLCTVETVEVDDLPQAPESMFLVTLPDNLMRARAGLITAVASTPVDGKEYNKVRFRITVDAPQPFTSPDQVMVVATEDSPVKNQVAFTLEENGDLVGFWGPESWSQLPPGYLVGTTFSMTVQENAPDGPYSVSVELEINDKPLQGTAGTVEINPVQTPKPIMLVALPENLTKGSPEPWTFVTSNPSNGQAYNNIRFRIVIDAPQPFTSPDQVTAVVAKGDPAEGQEIAFTLDDNGDLEGWWGPDSGFQMPPGYLASTNFDVTVKEGAPEGPYHVWISLMNDNEALIAIETIKEVLPPTPADGGNEGGTPSDGGNDDGTPSDGGNDGGTPSKGGNDGGNSPGGGNDSGTPSGGGNSGGAPSGGNSSGMPAPATDKVEKAIQSETTTVAELSGKVKVEIPAGSVSGANATINLEVLDDDKASGSGMSLLSKVVDITLKNGTLTGNLVITLNFDKNKLGKDQEPAAFYYDEKAGKWVRLKGIVDLDKGTVTVTVDHLTMFAVFAVAKEAQPSPPSVITFNDMQGHWAESTVAKLAGMGIISGYPDGTFKPERQVTRAEIASILVRALKLDPGSEQDLKFKDNAAIPAWAKGAIAAAAKEGIFKGYPQSDGTVTFEPMRTVTRAELAALMTRLLEKKLGDLVPAELKFTDTSQIPTWAREDISIAFAKGIIAGYPDGTFRASRPVTRAEAAVMISRWLNAVEAVEAK